MVGRTISSNASTVGVTGHSMKNGQIHQKSRECPTPPPFSTRICVAMRPNGNSSMRRRSLTQRRCKPSGMQTFSNCALRTRCVQMTGVFRGPYPHWSTAVWRAQMLLLTVTARQCERRSGNTVTWEIRGVRNACESLGLFHDIRLLVDNLKLCLVRFLMARNLDWKVSRA